jgi:hypothetical protein
VNIIDLTEYNFPQNRDEFRKELIRFFLSELPGTGKGEYASRNRYIVKLFGDHQIYLQRPAQFNNGFDFTLNVSGINFNEGYYNDKGNLKRATTRPSHRHILDDLIAKKNENLQSYNLLLNQITRVFNCQTPVNTDFNFNSGYDTTLVLECIRWLFAEQDITYWHYSGRGMLYNEIHNI